MILCLFSKLYVHNYETITGLTLTVALHLITILTKTLQHTIFIPEYTPDSNGLETWSLYPTTVNLLRMSHLYYMVIWYHTLSMKQLEHKTKHLKPSNVQDNITLQWGHPQYFNHQNANLKYLVQENMSIFIIILKSESRYNIFHWIKYIWKYYQQNVSNPIPA